MFISTFDMFKIGIGPSSSHTLGPMKAGKAFVDELSESGLINSVTRVQADVYGSLSLTGKGHATDSAIILGLAGNIPQTVDVDSMPIFLERVRNTEKLCLNCGDKEVDFPKDQGVVFHSTNLPLHENGMTLTAFQDDEVLAKKTYYSIGGGFIVDEEHFGQPSSEDIKVPFEFSSAEELLEHCKRQGMSIPEIAWQNELAVRSRNEIDHHLVKVWDVMRTGIERGSSSDGVLPGALHVPRRAAALRRRLEAGDFNDPLVIMSWINMFALAVNEENALGGRVVTAPTNGACGVIPAVLSYYDKFVQPVDRDTFEAFFLACTQIGALYKMNASISGAEVGCQGEVGVACSMAAAGLAQLLGGTPEQVCSAAEIGMEHNLGLTCDPVCGQVQVPCIERNAVAAVTAVNSARMALQRESMPTVSLDKVITTMYQTGKDMNAKYRETSQGGLARVVMPEMLPCS
ncbi:L-serine ammonia-lyase [Corynebacterium epidermidicanis]|uniref:L-serine dehydratase n=1 Tax=Corynebacterium epidermidicanis TaxID=1050174 RepID=A0A0G3GRP3_9CORY|nr:L-serine ammonia-lyase [Corynebacterium epidermidicanis]AKK03230.1 L-serine dehydratase, iron-sulfur-dependent, single chain form [Corynebacterium epidermidicanis]